MPQVPPALDRFARGAIAAAGSLRDSRVVDRLVRGTSWIWLLGILLIGLVGLNVSLLKLNAAAGRNAEWAKKLRVENADLRARVSRLGGGQQIQQAARDMGLVMPAADNVHYLKVNPGDARQAAKRGSFVPLSTTDDLVSATPPPDPVVVTPPVAAQPLAGTTGTAGPTGTTGAASPTTTSAPTTTTPAQPATSTTGATGATTP